MSDIVTRAEEWCAPISEDAFCGEDCRYDDAFEAVEVELKKLISVEGLQPDWSIVMRQASMLLQSRTKDITLLSALCVSLMIQERYRGLAAGLLAFARLVEGHWEDLHPPTKRLRGRAGDYTWMVQQVTRLAESTEPTPDEHSDLVQVMEHFDLLDTLLRDKWAELHPAVGGLRRVLKAQIEQTEPVAEEAVPEPAAEEPAAFAEDRTPTDAVPRAAGQPAAEIPAAPALVGGELPSRIVSDQQAEQVVEQVLKALKLASEYYQQRAETLEQERQRIEQRLRRAERIVELQKNVSTLLSSETGGGGESSE